MSAGDTMKALTIRQPWAWLIVNGTKRVENRSWHLPQRMIGERIYIHAAVGMTRDEWYDAHAFVERLGMGGQASRIPPPVQLTRGAIIGTAVLNGCLCEPSDNPWHIAGQHGFLLTDVRPMAASVPCKGALGFWIPDAATLAAL